MPVLISPGGAVLAGFILKRTAFGWAVYAVGGNETASRFSGIAPARTDGATHVVSGLATVIAARIMGSRVTGARNSIGPGYDLTGLAGIIPGGTLRMGGSGSNWRKLTGITMRGAIRNGLPLRGGGYDLPWLIRRAVTIAATWLDPAARRERVPA